MKTCSRAERAVARAPAPHHDEARVDVVDRLAPGALVLGLGAVGLLDGKDLGLRREVAPELGATAEHVEEPLAHAAAVQGRQATRARAVEDRGRPVRVAYAKHLAGDLVERVVPGDSLELPGAARSGPAQRVLQTIRMVHPLGLAEAAHAGVERRHLGGPAAWVGADLRDLSIAHVGVDGAAATAVVSAGAGYDGLARLGRDPWRFVDDPGSIHGNNPTKFRAAVETRLSPPRGRSRSNRLHRPRASDAAIPRPA
jgi:hypothetical protein